MPPDDGRANVAAAQGSLRRRSPRIANPVRGHVGPDPLRCEIDRLQFGPAPEGSYEEFPKRLASGSGPRGPIVIQALRRTAKGPNFRGVSPQRFGPFF